MANPEWENYSGPASVSVTRDDLGNLPVYIDGSDGSLWRSRSSLDEASSDSETAARHFIRLSDLLKLFIPLIGESPVEPTVVIPPCIPSLDALP